MLAWSFHLGANASVLDGWYEPAWSASLSWHGPMARPTSVCPSAAQCADLWSCCCAAASERSKEKGWCVQLGPEPPSPAEGQIGHLNY